MNTDSMAAHFDRKAADWDANERHLALTADILKAVTREWPVNSSPRLLDYGAGTGLCSLALAPRCASVLAMDVSAGMLSRLEEKARASGMTHLQTRQQDLCSEPLLGQRFDVILCAMTLHHVTDIEPLLERFHAMLEPGGFIAIADLDKEDGTFHDEPAGVHHHGFIRECLSRKMMAAGFAYVTIDTVHSIRKTRESGIIEYPVFCAVGRLRDAGSDPEQTT